MRSSVPRVTGLGALLGLSLLGSSLGARPPGTLPVPGEVFWNQAGLKLVWAPPGKYLRGSPKQEPGRFKDEGPVFEVEIGQGFWVSAFEVTQAQFQEVMGRNPSRFQGPHRPVERVTWEEARVFCMELTEAEHRAGQLPLGWRYRLPTEAEWEYVARAGTRGETFAGSLRRKRECDAPGLDPLAWYCGNNATEDPADHDVKAWTTKRTPARFAGTHRVGSRRPNPWGLFDVLGNVYEWCQDLYVEDYWEAPRDGRAAGLTGARGKRVLRGGAWISDASSCRIARRHRFAEDLRVPYFGFRPVLAPPRKAPERPQDAPGEPGARPGRGRSASPPRGRRRSPPGR